MPLLQSWQALETSDVTLMDSDLNKLLFSMKMGSKVIATEKENIVFILITNATAVGLIFAGKMTLLLAIAFDVGAMLLVTLNGMKLLSERTIRALEECSSIKSTSAYSLKLLSNRKEGKHGVLIQVLLFIFILFFLLWKTSLTEIISNFDILLQAT